MKKHTLAVAAVLSLLLLTAPGFSAAGHHHPSSSAPPKELDLKAHEGKALIVFCYALENARTPQAVQLMNELYLQRANYNFDIIGISLNPGRRERVLQFNREHGVAFPVAFDDNSTIAEHYKIRGGLGFLLFNEQGRRTAGKLAIHTPPHMNLKQQWHAYLGRYLHMNYIPADRPVLGLKPAVPQFEALTLDGRKISPAALYQSKPLVLAIFSPRCGNCARELAFLNSLYTGELKGSFEILAVSVLPRAYTGKFIEQTKYRFPVVVDPGKRIAAQFPSYTGPVPTTFVISREGTIEDVHIGFRPYLMDIYRMQLRKLAGLPNPPLLARGGFSGAQRCAVCHEQQQMQWSLTGHAGAFASLRRKAKTDDPACVSCHVTGYGQAGGYAIDKPTKYLEDVQCENCHGRGDLSCSAFSGTKAEKKTAAQWKTLCLGCHTEKKSLNFVFSKRFPLIRHSALPDLSSLSRSERLALLNRPSDHDSPFSNPARYVGAGACRECHPEQYRQWQTTMHAALQPAETTPDHEQLYRFVTGLGADGGYPEPGRTGVQCEACHGPAERHLKQPDAKGHDYIVGLGAECSSCVVEQICRSCHSPPDDPDFDFERQIGKVRHPAPAQDTQPPSGR